MSTNEGRRSLLLRNGVLSLLSWGFPIVLGLVVTPILVKRLGTESYGLYALLLGFMSYSFAFGIGKSALKFVAEHKAKGETAELSESISAVFLASLIIGIIGFVIIALAAPAIVTDVLQIPEASRQTAITAIYITSIAMTATMLSQVFQFVLQGLHRFDIYVLVSNVGGIALGVGNIVIAYTTLSVVHMIAWNVAVVAAMGIAYFVVTLRLLPVFPLTLNVRRDIWRKSLGYGSNIILYQVFGNVLLLFERGWIVRRFGTDALTHYVVPMLLGFFFHGLTSSLSLVIMPAVNEMLDAPERLARLYRAATKIILILSAMFVLNFVTVGKEFLSIWVSPELADAAYPVLIFHVLTFTVLSVLNVSWQVTESFGRSRVNTYGGIAWCLISITLMLSINGAAGITGVAAARFIGVLALLPIIFYVERNYIPSGSVRFWTSTLDRLIPAGLLGAASEYLVISVLHPGLVTFLISVIIGNSIFVPALLVFGVLENDEQEIVRSLFRKLESVRA